MKMTNQQFLRIRSSVATLFFMVMLNGCAGFHLHDANNEALANKAQKEYKENNVSKVIETEEKNLTTLLNAELKANRENHALRLDLALLKIADNDTPMAETRVKKAGSRITNLGFNEQTGIKAIREGLAAEIAITDHERNLLTHTGNILASGGSRPPSCMSENMPLALENSQPTANVINQTLYMSSFKKLQKKLVVQKNKINSMGGEVKETLDQWQLAQKELSELDMQIFLHKQNVAIAAKEYKTALEQTNPDNESLAEVQNKAEALQKIINSVGDKVAKNSDSEPDAGVATKERIKAINTILQTIAGGKATEEITDPNLKKAAVIAETIPSLANEIKAFHDDAETPTVSNLLIEMRYQQLIQSYVEEQRQLTVDRVGFLRQAYQVLWQEAKHWLEFHESMCNYAQVNSGLIASCSLMEPWKKALKTDNKQAKRELYKALAAFSLAMQAREQLDEIDLRVTDLDHRRAVAANRATIHAWDNLISVPIDQLAAYHSSGIKASEIADLLVKAIGLGAIAVGVSK